jgi:hypothetical protein
MGLLNRAVQGKRPASASFISTPEPQASITVKKPPQKRGLLNRVSQKMILEKTILENLSGEQNSFQGVIIEALNYSAGGFSSRILSMVSGFGSAQPLTPGRCLVVFDANKDGELIASHISKMVSGKNIYHFHAETPKEAIALLKPHL